MWIFCQFLTYFVIQTQIVLNVAQTTADNIKHRSTLIKRRFLWHKHGFQAVLNADFTVIRRHFACNNFQQRRLPSPIATHNADFIASVYIQKNTVQ